MTYQITQAQEKVHIEYKDTIIVYFKSIGLSLLINRSEDHLLKVQDYLYLTYRDQYQVLNRTTENLVIINDNIIDIIKVNNNERGLLYTIKEVVEGIIIKEEDENNIITDSIKSFWIQTGLNTSQG